MLVSFDELRAIQANIFNNRNIFGNTSRGPNSRSWYNGTRFIANSLTGAQVRTTLEDSTDHIPVIHYVASVLKMHSNMLCWLNMGKRNQIMYGIEVVVLSNKAWRHTFRNEMSKILHIIFCLRFSYSHEQVYNSGKFLDHHHNWNIKSR